MRISSTFNLNEYYIFFQSKSKSKKKTKHSYLLLYAFTILYIVMISWDNIGFADNI